ncbi:uncharacterized protein LOC134820766 [Bolinopsis microptera]|uniref:uncharacterized protein LOC134820766 n=1 Tax=Bolinopsis microptera TaxID=2820187 RepID=UPI00307957D4
MPPKIDHMEIKVAGSVSSNYVPLQDNDNVLKDPRQLEENGTCSNCAVEKAQVKDETVLDNRVTHLASDVTEIKKLLENVIAGKSINHSPVDNLISTAKAQCTLKPATDQGENVWLDEIRTKSLLVVTKGANVPCKDLEKTVVDNGIQVHKQYVDSNGDQVLILPTQASRDNLKTELISSGIAANQLKEPKQRYPTISVVGLPKDFSRDHKEEIRNTILKQNPYISHCLKADPSLFDVLSVKPLRANQNIKQAIIRLSDNIRIAIRDNNNRLFFGLLSCQVYDQLYIKRCNKCQGFGHYSKTCKNEVYCGFCAAPGHETQQCDNKDNNSEEKNDLMPTYCCINCKKSGSPDDLCKHAAFSTECPSYRVQQEKLKASLSYYSKN